MELDPNVFTWNIAMVCEWLSRSNLSHLSPTFQANEVDGPTLLSLTPDDIRDELQIKSLGDRKRVKEAIEKLHFSIDFVDQRVSLNLMVVDAREYAEQHEVYEGGGEDANVAVVEQMRELNKLEDVIESGMAAFECENMEMKTEADYNEAQHLSGMFETLRVQEFRDHNMARTQSGMQPLPIPDTSTNSVSPPASSASSSSASWSYPVSLPNSTSSASTRPSFASSLTRSSSILSPGAGPSSPSSSPSPSSSSSGSLLQKLASAASEQTMIGMKPLKRKEVLHMQQQALAREGAANKKEVGQQKGSCAACDDKNVLVFELACSHTYCTKCTAELFMHAIRDHSLMPPKCCQIEIDANLVFELLEPADAQEFSQHYLEVTAVNKMYCPNSSCSQFINLDLVAPESSYEFQCPKCRTAMCINCKLHAHAGLSCDKAKKRSNPLDQAFLTLANENNWRKCEKCGRMIELIYGCNHMICSCKHEFCFVCGSKWNPRECTCATFTEALLELAVEERRPANDIERAHIANALRNRAECRDHNWRYVHGPRVSSCENCGYQLWVYGYVSTPSYSL